MWCSHGNSLALISYVVRAWRFTRHDQHCGERKVESMANHDGMIRLAFGHVPKDHRVDRKGHQGCITHAASQQGLNAGSNATRMLSHGESRVGQPLRLTIWSRPGEVVQKSSTYPGPPFDPCHLLSPKRGHIWLPLFPNLFFSYRVNPGDRFSARNA